MIPLQEALRILASDLRVLDVPWALVGGLAVSVRAEPRTTRDVDVAVTVMDDQEAGQLSKHLKARGYKLNEVFEQERANRLATLRFLTAGEELGGVVIDVLVASSGIEPEIVTAAEEIEFMPGLRVPVARIGHLLAVKVLAGRKKDLVDIESLLSRASAEDLRLTSESLDLIERRGFHRQKDLQADFARLLH